MANDQEAPTLVIPRRKQDRDFIVSAERWSEDSTKDKGLSQGPAGTIAEPGRVVKDFSGILWAFLGAENPNLVTPLAIVCKWDDTVSQPGGSLTNRVLIRDAVVSEELLVPIAGQTGIQYQAMLDILKAQNIIVRPSRSTI